MKKILIIYKFLPQYRKEFFNLLRIELAKIDIELELVYGKSKEAQALEREVDIDWAKYVPNKRLKIGNTELLWQPCLKYLKGTDLVIIENANRLLINYYLMFARHFSKFKLAYWGHGRDLQSDEKSYRNKFKYLFLKQCDWWFGYTNGTKDFLVSRGYPENKITVFQNAIDTVGIREYYSKISDSQVQDLKRELGITSDKTAIFCGAMYPEKRLDFVLEACGKIKQEIPEFHMIFIGSGKESFRVTEAAAMNSWIHYVGPKFGYDRIIYFKISSLQLMPGLVGLGVLDSFALETPIITTHSEFHGPEIEYLESGINGYITQNNIEKFSSKVIDLLKGEKYLELIEGCKVAAEKYTVETMVSNFTKGVIACLED